MGLLHFCMSYEQTWFLSELPFKDMCIVNSPLRQISYPPLKQRAGLLTLSKIKIISPSKVKLLKPFYEELGLPKLGVPQLWQFSHPTLTLWKYGAKGTDLDKKLMLLAVPSVIEAFVSDPFFFCQHQDLDYQMCGTTTMTQTYYLYSIHWSHSSEFLWALWRKNWNIKLFKANKE